MTDDTPPPRYRDYPSIGLALAFVLLGAWVLAETGRMTALGSIFPRAVAVALIALSLALIGQQLRRPVRPPAAGRAPRRRIARPVGLAAVMAAWALLFPLIGFFVTSLVAFVALLAVANYDGWTPRRLLGYAVTALAVVTGFYLLFVEALLVPVPRGWLF